MDASYLTGQPVIWDGTVLPLGKAWAEDLSGFSICSIPIPIFQVTDQWISPRKRFNKPAEGRLDRLP